jgi:RHS repeat-associated protein
MSYTYDNDSRVTGITYKFNTNTLGNLTYSYDSLGRRTQVGGSFAQTGLPGAISSASYDAANELTNWNGTTISYDLNGNMLSDGANTFFWNARNQVATLSSVSLQYDGFGRRTKNLHNTSFLFDGANAAQELSGSTVTANLISGGIDEIFARADSSGSFTQLKDALGSIIGLVDASGNLVTQYSYDPFGNTTATGSVNSNGFQYTGRENEGNSLYFYRARYYSPVLGRFVNEDPLGFAGSGPNFYAYVFDSPTNLTDPFGLAAPALLPALGGAAGAGTGLTLIQGGAGAGATISGTIVETGSIGGPAGVAVAGAGVVGWGIGRGVGHVPLFGGGGTVDDGWQGIFTSLFFSNADPNPGAGTAFNPHPLAGRNCKNKPTEEECDEMYETDLETCRKLRSRSCYAQAAERWAACKAGKPIPPFPFRLPN